MVSQARFQRIEKRRAAATLRDLAPPGRARARRLKAQARIAQELPVLLGLLDRIPRQKAVNKSAHVVAVYVGIEDRIYLISDAKATRRQTESTLSHELTHALDRQNLGRRGPELSSPFTDASDARFAVQEGSAELIQFRYERRYLGEHRSVASRLRDPGPDFGGSKLDRLLNDGADFSYRQGALFVRALYRRGGPALVNRAVRHPPLTTASIYDPARWPAHDAPLPPAGAVTPGPGWARSYSGNFGAASTHQLLFLTSPGPSATRLVRDWRGGTVELWQRSAAVARRAKPTRTTSVTAVRWHWRSPADAALAPDAVGGYLAAAFHAQPAGVGVWSWAGGGAALTSAGTTTTLVIAPSVAVAAATAAVGS